MDIKRVVVKKPHRQLPLTNRILKRRLEFVGEQEKPRRRPEARCSAFHGAWPRPRSSRSYWGPKYFGVSDLGLDKPERTNEALKRKNAPRPRGYFAPLRTAVCLSLRTFTMKLLAHFKPA